MMPPDANLAAKKRAQEDQSERKVDLGIGVIGGENGKPFVAQSYYDSLWDLTGKIRSAYERGKYLDPDPQIIRNANEYLLNELCIPPMYRDLCIISWCEGGGSGALERALKFIFCQNPDLPPRIIVQEQSWVGYASFARAHRLALGETPINFQGINADSVLIAQTVHNGTGRKIDLVDWFDLAMAYAINDTPLVLDIPYSGFDYADLPLMRALQMSAKPIAAMFAHGTPMVIAWSPTKTKGTFYARAGGAMIVVCSNQTEYDQACKVETTVKRGGTGFMSLGTYALLVAMSENAKGLREDHEKALHRIERARADWQQFSSGPLANYFDPEKYGGLFRTIHVQPRSAKFLAERHLHVVEVNPENVRINITGLPGTNQQEWVDLLASRCIVP